MRWTKGQLGGWLDRIEVGMLRLMVGRFCDFLYFYFFGLLEDLTAIDGRLTTSLSRA